MRFCNRMVFIFPARNGRRPSDYLSQRRLYLAILILGALPTGAFREVIEYRRDANEYSSPGLCPDQVDDRVGMLFKARACVTEEQLLEYVLQCPPCKHTRDSGRQSVFQTIISIHKVFKSISLFFPFIASCAKPLGSMAAQLSPSDPAYHMDWIFGASNVHYANHKGWFTKFTPFDSTCGNGVGSIKVKGK